MGRGGSKVFFIAGAVVLTALLFLAPKKSMKPIEEAASPEVFNFNELMAYQENNLSPEEHEKLNLWKSRIEKNSSGGLSWYDSLVFLWDSKKVFALSGYYFEQKASVDHTERSHLNPAYRYFDAYKNSVDSTVRGEMVAAAMRNYGEVLQLNPDQLDAKTDLGILYAEASPEPMKGIRMLQEVVTADPKHENAQLNLGILSIRSGQYEKAIERFNKVLQVNPSRNEAYLLMAQAYVESGDHETAVEWLEKYKASVLDPEVMAQVERMIEKLK